MKEAWKKIDADGSLAACLEYEAKHRPKNISKASRYSSGILGKRGWGALTRLYDWEIETKTETAEK
ncbi:MAG: hypothetical protein LBJ35_08160 [Spirochaetaceae bacterium]|nr:hypothetical protein [Spirochaetaceae bacterium]